MRLSHVAFCTASIAAMSLPAYAATGDDIAPAKVDMANYEPLTCQQLADYSVTLDGAYKAGVDNLDNGRAGRIALVIFVGDFHGGAKTEAYLADVKGRQVAVHQVQAEKSCMTPGANSVTTASAAPQRSQPSATRTADSSAQATATSAHQP